MRKVLSTFILVSSFFSPIAAANTHRPEDFLNSIKGTPNEGEQIYHHFCVNCHAKKPTIPLGAPRTGVKEDWHTRLKQGWPVLFKHTDEGLNAMPPRGGCFECSNEQLALAIIEMIPNKAKNSILNDLKNHKKINE